MTCKTCQTDFTPTHPKTVCCSQACQDAWAKARRSAAATWKHGQRLTCRICGETFTAYTYRAATCSASCAKEARRRYSAEQRLKLNPNLKSRSATGLKPVSTIQRGGLAILRFK